MAEKKKNIFENTFESFLWNSRFGVILAVIFGLLSSLTLFVLGSVDIYLSIKDSIYSWDNKSVHTVLVGNIIGAIDLYLIGIVLLIFSFGVYELFISKIDIGRSDREINILEITTLDQLKNRLLKVVIMVLIISFFKKVLNMEIHNFNEMFLFALSILAICAGLYFMHKQDS